MGRFSEKSLRMEKSRNVTGVGSVFQQASAQLTMQVPPLPVDVRRSPR